MTRVPGWKDELLDLDREKVKGFVQRNRKFLVEKDANAKGKDLWVAGRLDLIQTIIGEIVSGAWDSKRPSKAHILARLRIIEADSRFPKCPDDVAKIEINAPLALIQVQLETEFSTLQKMLGEAP